MGSGGSKKKSFEQKKVETAINFNSLQFDNLNNAHISANLPLSLLVPYSILSLPKTMVTHFIFLTTLLSTHSNTSVPLERVSPETHKEH